MTACLEQARRKEQAGDLRGAFLTCQSLLIDQYGDIPKEPLASIYAYMGQISTLQGKRERADKYLKKAQALCPSQHEIKKQFEELGDKPPGERLLRATALPFPGPAPSTQAANHKGRSLEETTSAARSIYLPEIEKVSTVASIPEPEPQVRSMEAEAPANRLFWVAGFWLRLAAFLLDTLVVATILVLTVLLSSLVLEDRGNGASDSFFEQTSSLIAVAAILAFFQMLYLTMAARFGGQSVGKMLVGIRVVGLDGHSISTLQALRRAGGMLLAALPGLAGFFWIAFDIHRRGWHDHIGETLVVMVRPREKTKARVRESDGSLVR